MNDLQIFKNLEFGEVRTVMRNGEPWFVAADVCKALEIANPTDAIKRLDEDERTRFNLGLSGGETNIVNEPGLYVLVLGSRKPEARAFKRWITHEVIPTIRKHGLYATPEAAEAFLSNPDMMILTLTRLKEERAEKERLALENERKDQLIGELQPKADYVDHILSSIGTMATTQIAADYGLTANRLNKILFQEGIQHKVGDQWVLYKKHMGKGYTKSETIPITRTDGRPDTKLFTRWTQKGRLMINEVLNKRGIYANMDIIRPLSKEPA